MAEEILYRDIPLEIRVVILMKDIDNYNTLIDADQDLRLFFDNPVNFKWFVENTRAKVSQFGFFYPNKDQYCWIDKIGSVTDYNINVRNVLNTIQDCYEFTREFNTIIQRDSDGIHISRVKDGPVKINILHPCNSGYGKRDPFVNMVIETNYRRDILHGNLVIYKGDDVVVNGKYINGRLSSYNRKDKTGYLGISTLLDGDLEIPFIGYNLVETYEDGELCGRYAEDIDEDY